METSPPMVSSVPNIEISQETFDALRSRVRDFGESPESVIRRLLAGDETPESSPPPKVSSPLLSLIASPDFQCRNGRDRYFLILRHLNEVHGGQFVEKACGLKFGKRIQIARTKEEIDKSGKSTYPEKIPGTHLWALTNLSNRSKRDVLFAILQRLNYPQEEIRSVLQGIPDSTSSRIDALLEKL